jgi:hypothetical protein
VDPAAYDALTEALTESLGADDRVLGLVLLGSSAAGADPWSDHDFFVVTRPGVQEELRTDLAWLPSGVELVLSFRETAHGLKLLTRDGHLLELAVFDLDELALASVNRYRVVLDRGGVAERMAEVAAPGGRSPASLEHHLGQLVTCALVGALRHRRGETLSGATFVTSLALRHLLELVAATVPPADAEARDDLDPFRRFERAYPDVGAELAALLREPPDVAAAGLLAVAERVVRPLCPELAWDALRVAAERIRGA